MGVGALLAIRGDGPRHFSLFLINHTEETVTVPVAGEALARAELTGGRDVVPPGPVVVVREDHAPVPA